jgi:hypothetical protein
MHAPLSSIHRMFANVAESRTDSIAVHRDNPPFAPGTHLGDDVEALDLVRRRNDYLAGMVRNDPDS